MGTVEDHLESVHFQESHSMDNDEELSEPSVSSLNKKMRTSTAEKEFTCSPDLHRLLVADIDDAIVFASTSPQHLISVSLDTYLADEDFSKIVLCFNTSYIETETACQWQLCNSSPLICELLVQKQFYANEKVIVDHVYQQCSCHPMNEDKVPFIERLVRDFFDKTSVCMETLKLSRATRSHDDRVKCFLELISNKTKRTEYEAILTCSDDKTVLDELIEFEILDSKKESAKKLQLLRSTRRNTETTSDKHYDLLDPKHLPSLVNGRLVQFCKYIVYRLKHLNSLCVMCGKRTIDTRGKKAAKPTICDSYECFSNAMDSKFRRDPLPPSIFSIEIADFLLLLIYAAIHSTRQELILDPYPILVNPYNTSTTLLDRNGNKQENLKILTTIVNALMSMGSITQYEVERISLRSTIELKHPWGFSFFHWLMGTNRYHFSLIPKEHHLSMIRTDFQYFIKHEDIVKNVRFKELRNQHGTIFAFHGSPQENWHSILRSGLQIGKGGYQINGAVYGSGIYVSPQLAFASSYTRSLRGIQSDDYTVLTYDQRKNMTPLQNHHWSCIALCEIINSPEVYKKHSSQIWTIQNPDLICTRFIFFFPQGTSSTNYDVDSTMEATALRERIHLLNGIAC